MKTNADKGNLEPPVGAWANASCICFVHFAHLPLSSAPCWCCSSLPYVIPVELFSRNS